MKVLLLLLLLGQLELDPLVEEVRKQTGTPSMGVAVLRNGKAQVYGNGSWCIGSVSKQFTAAAVMHLVEEGKMTLDDRVSQWLPGLKSGGKVSVRQLLSMTAGYRDYWPQDYVMPMMLEPITPLALAQQWAGLPLDFEPGTAWQYSNTNYVVAGLIVEKASGQPLFSCLKQWIFQPVGMETACEVDTSGLGGYRRFALGEPTLAPHTGSGWLFAAGGLAMTVADLAAWNDSFIRQTVLKPSSYAEMARETVLANGVGTRYGLGLVVTTSRGRRLLSHGGEISGFTTTNHIFPDDGVAVSVVANLDASDATSRVADRVLDLVFPVPAGDESRVKKLLGLLAEGKVDAEFLTPNCRFYFSPQALADYAATLGPLGPLMTVAPLGESKRGGMVNRNYRLQYAGKSLRLSTYVTPEGKFEQFLLLP